MTMLTMSPRTASLPPSASMLPSSTSVQSATWPLTPLLGVLSTTLLSRLTHRLRPAVIFFTTGSMSLSSTPSLRNFTSPPTASSSSHVPTKAMTAARCEPRYLRRRG
jgi:hypothetical protein